MRLTQYLRAVAAKIRSERADLDWMDVAMREAGEQLAVESGVKRDLTLDRPEWLDLAAPLIERFEGMARLIPGGKVEAYPDPGTGGKPWTIGIGSTTDEDGGPIKPGTVWTVERARKRFEAHLREFGAEVDKQIAGKRTTAAQKAAMTSLAYNIGVGAFSRSTVLKSHRAGFYDHAANAFLMWNKAGGKVMRGLTRRREAERELYLRG